MEHGFLHIERPPKVCWKISYPLAQIMAQMLGWGGRQEKESAYTCEGSLYMSVCVCVCTNRKDRYAYLDTVETHRCFLSHGWVIPKLELLLQLTRIHRYRGLNSNGEIGDEYYEVVPWPQPGGRSRAHLGPHFGEVSERSGAHFWLLPPITSPRSLWLRLNPDKPRHISVLTASAGRFHGDQKCPYPWGYPQLTMPNMVISESCLQTKAAMDSMDCAAMLWHIMP